MCCQVELADLKIDVLFDCKIVISLSEGLYGIEVWSCFVCLWNWFVRNRSLELYCVPMELVIGVRGSYLLFRMPFKNSDRNRGCYI